MLVTGKIYTSITARVVHAGYLVLMFDRTPANLNYSSDNTEIISLISTRATVLADIFLMMEKGG
jgi:hypothetical protein